MKRIISIFMCFALLFALAACADNESGEKKDENKKEIVRIASLKGPTSMGIVKLMQDAEDGKTANDYEFTIAGSADEIVPKFIKGEYDIAAIPANLASTLWNRTNGEIRVVSLNTLCVLYIVAKGNEVDSVSDLNGKTIYATGKGSTPEYCLVRVLENNGLKVGADVKIEWKSEPAEVVSLLSASDGIAMLPQPYVTVAKNSVEGLEIKLSMNDEWNAVPSSGTFVTGVFAVRKEFAQKHPDAVAAFAAEAAASASYANANVDETAALVEKYGIVKAAVAKQAIPYCNIVYIDGSEMKTALDGFLGVLNAMSPDSIGGKLPDASFYYERNEK